MNPNLQPKSSLKLREKLTLFALLALLILPTAAWAQQTPSSLPLPQTPATTPQQIPLNIAWTLFAGFLVLFMQLGFAMVETGLCRAKNAGHTFAMKMMIFPLAAFAFWAYGFALGWGNAAHGPAPAVWFASLGHGLANLNTGFGIAAQPDGSHQFNLLGAKGFFLSPDVADPAVLTLFFFMLALMLVAATIPTGAMAERWSWNSFCLYGLWIALPFSLYANWIWGGGWLSQMGRNWGLGNGACDFAGSGVVHCMGGIIALAGSICIGPRIGKFYNGKAQAIPGHNLPMVMAGTLILAFGWLGLNPGSTLSASDSHISFIAVNTLLAAMMGALASMAVMQFKFGKPDPSLMCNGLLAGLVAITAPCAYVSPLGAAIIGTVAGLLVVYSVFFWDKIGVDDPVGAISVHGVTGAWGVLAVGLFACGDYGQGTGGQPTPVTGIFPIGSLSNTPWFSRLGVTQLAAQSISLCILLAVGFLIAFTLFKITNRITPLRVSHETEIQGLDIPETGALAYPDFELRTTHTVTDVGASRR